MPKQLYLLDTYSANKPTNDSFNVSFPLRTAVYNIKSISLKSLELPIFLFNFKSGNSSTTFSFNFNYPSYNGVGFTQRSVSLIPGNYSVAGLISALNSKISSEILSTIPGFSLSLSAQTSAAFGLTICRISTNAAALNLDNTLLINQALGYSTNRSTTSLSFDSQSPINVNLDTCIFMSISNLPVTNNNLSSLVSLPPYTFKIPLNNFTNNIIYFNDTSQLQTIYFNNNSFVLDRLDIKIYDRYGNLLYGYYDYTMGLIIEYDDNVNNNKIEFLNIYN